MKKKIIRITTIPASLRGLLKGQLRFMSNHFEIIAVSSKLDGLLKEVGDYEGVKTIPVEMTRKITPLKDLIGVYKLYKIFKNEKPIIVHTHTPKAGTLGMLAAKLARVPYRLHTIAGLPLVESVGMKRKLLNSVEGLTYRCATKIYPNSYGLKNIILENKFTTEDKMEVIGNGSSNGIDTTHYDPSRYSENDKKELRKKLGIKLNEFVFIFVGRLVGDKGIHELIDSFVKFSSTQTKAKLLLVGTYETHRDPLNSETVEIINNNKNIIHAGWQNDVRPFLSISNALTFPSYREGFPNVVLQAGAMNLPCIVSNINGCNEIITNNINGIIVPVKNANEIYNAMEALILKSKDELNIMGGKSRDLIISKYDQSFVWNAILAEYNNLIEKHIN
tara:strand:- start:49224 stop:50393 length:1170 start_codon:yes stop_codon:yes gene_type:complete